ncbi:MAG TPA: amidohydrolase family protein [Rhizomicrobium sp.]|nr:amidohydrolase family protein [Rhizomicrobium sp.]
MRLCRLPEFALASVVLLAVCRAEPAAAEPCSLAITRVNVLPMDSERLLPDRTVLVWRGRITTIEPAARLGNRHCGMTVHGAGRYLVPGLNDMHVHIESLAFAQAFAMKAAPIDYPSEMALYMANGVTGIRVMSGAPDILAFRDSQKGTLSPYPLLVVATPMLAGNPPVLPEPVTRVLLTPEAARESVREFKRDGYDFVKVRDNLSAPVFRAVIDEAARNGLYVDGHISMGQGLSVFDVLRSGQKAIAHLDNLQLLMKDKTHDPDTYIQLLRSCGCFVETTLQVEANAYAQITDYERLIRRPELKYMHPLVLNAFWRKPNNPILKENSDPVFWRSLYADEKVLLKKLFDGGVHIVAGTDSLNPMIVPGTSLHDELSRLMEAGLTPYEALKTATANPASYVPGFSDVGVLAPGRVANALLVDTNPLRNMDTLRAPDAVMINGNWMTHSDLQRRLDAAAALYAKL